MDAQQARRVLDRLVGYELSPLLWKRSNPHYRQVGGTIGGKPRLIVEKEFEIKNFKPSTYFRV